MRLDNIVIQFSKVESDLFQTWVELPRWWISTASGGWPGRAAGVAEQKRFDVEFWVHTTASAIIIITIIKMIMKDYQWERSKCDSQQAASPIPSLSALNRWTLGCWSGWRRYIYYVGLCVTKNYHSLKLCMSVCLSVTFYPRFWRWPPNLNA